MGCISFSRGIFLTQVLSPPLLPWQKGSSLLSPLFCSHCQPSIPPPVCSVSALGPSAGVSRLTGCSRSPAGWLRVSWSCSLLLGFSPSRLHLFSSSPGRFFGLLLRFFLPGGAGLLLHFPALLRPSALGLHGGAAPVSAPLGAPPCYCSALRGPSGSGPCWLTPTGRPGAIIPLAGLAPQVQFAMVRRPAESWRPIQCFLSV